MRLRFLMVAVVVFCCASPASAQYFRNSAFSVKAGWLGLGSTWDNATRQKIWNMSDEGVIGAGANFAIGYNLWLDSSAMIGGGQLVIPDPQEILFTLGIDTGLRYNFLDEKVRPFVAGHIQYLQVVTPSAQIPGNAFFGNAPFWIGARVGGGVEVFVIDDQSLMAEVTINGYIGANTPPPGGIATFVLPAGSGLLSYQIYF